LDIAAGTRILRHPPKELSKRPRSSLGTDNSPHHAPHIFGCRTREKEMQMDSWAKQNWQRGSPVQFSFNILSFVTMALCQINHTHTLIFKGILFFRKCLNDQSMSFLHSCSYKLLTVNSLFFVHFYLGLSTESVKVP
jgi:hypothetical protein